MAYKDGSTSFDFEGVYTNIQEQKLIENTIGGGRKVKIVFSSESKNTKVIESFETKNIHLPELQSSGWQAILDNFKKYTEVH